MDTKLTDTEYAVALMLATTYSGTAVEKFRDMPIEDFFRWWDDVEQVYVVQFGRGQDTAERLVADAYRRMNNCENDDTPIAANLAAVLTSVEMT